MGTIFCNLEIKSPWCSRLNALPKIENRLYRSFFFKTLLWSPPPPRERHIINLGIGIDSGLNVQYSDYFQFRI